MTIRKNKYISYTRVGSGNGTKRGRTGIINCINTGSALATDVFNDKLKNFSASCQRIIIAFSFFSYFSPFFFFFLSPRRPVISLSLSLFSSSQRPGETVFGKKNFSSTINHAVCNKMTITSRRAAKSMCPPRSRRTRRYYSPRRVERTRDRTGPW